MSSSPQTAGHNLRHHFADFEQQHDTATMGMWLFLVTEIMFFGGMFCAYLVYRFTYFNAWDAGSQHMEITWGAINTVVLICSSLTMVLAVHAAKAGDRRMIVVRTCTPRRMPPRRATGQVGVR